MLSSTGMRRGRPSSGFTLLELIVTVAIIAVLLALAVYTVVRGRERINLERANLQMKGLLDQARALSAIAGSRVGTNRIVYGNGCTNERALSGGNPSQWQLWVRVVGDRIEFPARLADPGNDTLVVSCLTYDVPNATNSLGQLAAPTMAGELAFAPSGRLILRGIPGPYAYFQIQDPNDAKRYGVRVLPSGVTCEASVAAGPPWCDVAP